MKDTDEWSWTNTARCNLAGYLCRIAAWLRREPWYISDNWASVPGNRASELRQAIWENVVVLDVQRAASSDREALDTIDRDLAELAQAAGEAWGHCGYKEKKTP